jgi:acetyl-CoA synthetase
MISPLPGVSTTIPGSAIAPVPGISARIVDDHGNLVKRSPTCSASTRRAIWCWISHGQRCCAQSGAIRSGTKEQYWSRLAEQDWSFAAARATTTTPTSGCCVDDVMNVSAHRSSTAEVQSALVGHSHVAETAVVGATDGTTGQAIIAFVILVSHAKDRADGMVTSSKPKWPRRFRRRPK